MFGGNPPEYSIFVGGVFYFNVAKPFQGNKLRSVFNACSAGYFADRYGVVARDNFDFDVVFLKPFNRVDGVGTNVVGQSQDSDGAYGGGNFIPRDRGGRVRQHHNTQAHLCVLFDDFGNSRRHRAEDEFRRAHNKGTDVAKGHGGKFPLRRERQFLRCLQSVGMPKSFVQRNRRLVVVVEGGEDATQDIVYRVFGGVVE